MKKIIALLFIAAVLFAGCETYTSANGSRYRHLFPPKDKTGSSGPDTAQFVKLPFMVSDYTNQVAYKNGKRVIETIEGSDLREMMSAKGRYYIYLWNPGCPATRADIYKLDSLSKKGENAIIISLRGNYKLINTLLGKTNFSRYPLYIAATKKHTKFLVRRQIRFIAEACPECGDQYRDDLRGADLLLLEDDTIKVIMYNDKSGANVMSR